MKVVVDIVALRGDAVCLITRAKPPHQGALCLPGGHVEDGERMISAAQRELAEETGLTGGQWAPLGVFDDPDRDPRGHAVSIAFVCVEPDGELRASSDAATAQWVNVDDVGDLAFDHSLIFARARSG